MKSYLVTGGLGFIGSSLCKRLINEGSKVYCYDNLCTGNIWNVMSISNNINFHFIKNYDSLDFTKINAIFHLASPADPTKISINSKNVFFANINDTAILANLANENHIPFIFASSIRVLDSKETIYSKTKKIGENICNILNDIGANNKIVRMCNVYGPDMAKDDGRVIPVFIRKSRKNEDLVVMNDIDCFCYIDDMIDALISVCNSDKKGLFEVSSEDFIHLYDLAKKIISINNSKSDIVMKDIEENSNKRQFLFNNNMINWKPKISLDEGLEKMCSLYISI
jgi:nucleoside-diphosphate-sugar epimerase